MNGQFFLSLMQRLEHRGYTAGADASYDTELCQVPPQSIDEHGPLAHHQVAALMEHQHGLLFDRLHRDKPHCRTRHCLADRLCVSCVGLAALYVRFHVGWRHQPNLMPQCD